MSAPLRGIHSEVWTPATTWTLHAARPRLVKSMDWSPDWGRALREGQVDTFILRRWSDDDSSLVPSPTAAAERQWARFAPKLAAIRPHIEGACPHIWVEAPWNEAHQETPDQLARLAEACARFAELAEAAGWSVLVGNFSVCWPKLEHFPAFAPALAAGRGLSLHEYWMPGRLMPGEWTARADLLYATLPADVPRLPVYLTECGIDNVDRSRPVNQYGWRSYSRPDTDYVAELDAFAASQPPVVAGLAVFNSGCLGPRWTKFEIAESWPVADWLRAGPVAWTPPTDTLPEEPPMPDDTTWDPNPDRLAPVVSGGAIENYAIEHRLVFASPEEFGGGGHSWAILLDPEGDVAYRVEYTPRTGVRPFEQDRDA